MTHRHWKLFKYSPDKVLARTTTRLWAFFFCYLPLTSPLQVFPFFHHSFFSTCSSYLSCNYSSTSLSGSCPFACKFDGACSMLEEIIWAFPCPHVPPPAPNLLPAPEPPDRAGAFLQYVGLLSSIFAVLALGKHICRASFPPLTSKSYSDLKALSPGGISKAVFASGISKYRSITHYFSMQQFQN